MTESSPRMDEWMRVKEAEIVFLRKKKKKRERAIITITSVKIGWTHLPHRIISEVLLK